MKVSSNPITAQGVSPVEALWTLIQKQPKETRRTLTERLLSSDLEMGERLLLKASIERGWEQVKTMQKTGSHTSNLQDLINELKEV